jgi:lipopolysaccharide/colanic/teichoic acid biosynthesis glycosyltransferase
VVLVLIGLAIKLESPGPVIRRHRAVGIWGREFDLLRFRITVEEGDVPPGSDRSTASFPAADATPATWVGNLLRRWALDELPELVNVLKGDMSLVGPRPRLLADTGQDSEAEPCLPVKPGLTGVWHVRGSVADLDRPVDLEHYLRHRSLASDLGVLQRSVRAANRRQVR